MMTTSSVLSWHAWSAVDREPQCLSYMIKTDYNNCNCSLIANLIICMHTCLPAVTVVIDGYKHSSTLTSGDSVPLGIQLILVCQVVGLPYGTRLSYTWTCPNGPCEVDRYYGRKVYNERILAVNTTSTSDEGTYTCQVTATGGQEANGRFTVSVSGMCCTDWYVLMYIIQFTSGHMTEVAGLCITYIEN